MRSESTVEITKALASFQGALKPVAKSSINPFYKSKYADLSAIWELIRSPLSASGLAVTQGGQYQDGHIVLETTLLHESGEWLSTYLLVTPGKPNDPQAVGSAITYARRYALSAMLGVCSEDDDDAESAMSREQPVKTAKKQDSPLVAAAKDMGAVESGEIKNAGEFLTKALREHGLSKDAVEKLVGAVNGLSDFQGAWEFLEKNIGPKAP